MHSQPPRGQKLVGTASRVRIDQEGHRCVLRFVLELDARRLPVEMRGEQIDGFLSDGDEVSVPAESVASGTARPRLVENLTTETTVVVRHPGRLRRYSRLVGAGEIAAALISASLTSGVGLAVGEVRESNPSGRITSTARAAAPVPAPRREDRGAPERPKPTRGRPAAAPPPRSVVKPTPTRTTTAAMPRPARREHDADMTVVAALAAATAVVLALLLVLVLVRRRHASWRRIASTAAGAAVGLAIVVLVIRP